MFILGAIFAYFSVGFRFIANFAAFIGDAFIVLIYSLVAWGFVAPNQPPETYAQNLIDTHTLAFRFPLVVFIAYILFSSVLYYLLYQKVTTYARWIYAVRTLLLLFFPLALLAMVGKLALGGQLSILIQNAGEGFGLAIFTLAVVVCAWAFYGIAYMMAEWAWSLNIYSQSPTSTTPQTVMLPQRMFSILFIRKPEFQAPYTAPKQKYFRRNLL